VTRAPRRRAEELTRDERIEALETQSRWFRRGIAALLTVGLGGGAGYYRTWQTSTEERGVDRFRLARCESRLDRLETAFIAPLLPFLRNPPAPPADGDKP
jgi:hypothetical protein